MRLRLRARPGNLGTARRTPRRPHEHHPRSAGRTQLRRPHRQRRPPRPGAVRAGTLRRRRGLRRRRRARQSARRRRGRRPRRRRLPHRHIGAAVRRGPEVARHGGPPLRRPRRDPGRPPHPRRRGRRRRHRRPRRLRRRHLQPRPAAPDGPDDAPGDGGQQRRRQGRRQPRPRQEPDRRLPPAGRRLDRHGHARHPARPRVPQRPGRSRQIRRHPRRRTVRLAGTERRAGAGPRAGGGSAHRRSELPFEGRRGGTRRARDGGTAGGR